MPRSVVWGTLDINCSYDPATREIVFNQQIEYQIRDSYEIRIDFRAPDFFGFPSVFEESNTIRTFAFEHGIALEDLHINKNEGDSCCLGIFPEYKWAGAACFIRDKVIPFFYWQSYRRIYGEPPWRGYLHGIEGISEAMTSLAPHASKGGSRNHKCPCGSGRKYKQCCIDRDDILWNKHAELILRSRGGQ